MNAPKLIFFTYNISQSSFLLPPRGLPLRFPRCRRLSGFLRPVESCLVLVVVRLLAAAARGHSLQPTPLHPTHLTMMRLMTCLISLSLVRVHIVQTLPCILVLNEMELPSGPQGAALHVMQWKTSKKFANGILSAQSHRNELGSVFACQQTSVKLSVSFY